jgi:hypothetical protein
MPYVEVRGKYRTFRYDGNAPLDFTTYNNLLCVVRRPNPTTFITLQQYVPGQGGQFTTFQPGSSYTIVSRSDGTQETYNFDIGPYTRVDRLPSTINVKSPGFYIGLDKNSIVVPISSYALSVNNPLSSVVGINYINGQGNRLQYVYADNFKTGAPLNFTHFLPNSGYELRSRIPFTFFAPLQSEMGDAYATGRNDYGQLGMGYQYNSFDYTQLYGNWDKVVTSTTHAAALSTCGTKIKLFVCGGNTFGQLGLTPVVGGTLQPALTATQTVWKQLQSIWTWEWDEFGETYYYRDVLDTENILDVEVGSGFTLIKTDGQLYGCGLMCNMGIVPTGAQGSPDYQFNGAVNPTSINQSFIPYFTPFLFCSSSGSTLMVGPTSFEPIGGSNIKKFQARDSRWYWLTYTGKLFGQGKIAGEIFGNSSIVILPIGISTPGSPLTYKSYVVSTQLYGPGNPNNRSTQQFFSDFNASSTNIAALSSDNKTWVVGGAVLDNTSNLASLVSLSTICFFDPNQNAYVPQNDYFLRVYSSWYGFMAIYNGKLYFSRNVNNDQSGAGSNGTVPSISLPKLSGALGTNPEEQTSFRSLIPLTYMGRPDISWKSLYASSIVTAAIDINNKLYVCGNNYLGYLGAPSTTASINTLTQVITDDIFNVNMNATNMVVYKTNRNPATSPTPIPSPTPTPTPTPVPGVDKFALIAQNTSTNGSREVNNYSQIWEYKNNNFTTPTKILAYNGLTKDSVQGYQPQDLGLISQTLFDYEKGANSDLVAVVSDGEKGTRRVYRCTTPSASTWTLISTPSQLNFCSGYTGSYIPNYTSLGNDLLFITNQNTYYYYSYYCGTSPSDPTMLNAILYVSSSTDRGLTWTEKTEVLNRSTLGYAPINNIVNTYGAPLKAVQDLKNSYRHILFFPLYNNSVAQYSPATLNNQQGGPSEYISSNPYPPGPYDVVCGTDGNFHEAHLARSSGGGIYAKSLYLDGTLIVPYTLNIFAFDYNHSWWRVSSDTNSDRDRRGGFLSLTKRDNTYYILYVRRSVSATAGSWDRTGMGLIEYDSSAKTYTDTFIAGRQFDGSPLFTFDYTRYPINNGTGPGGQLTSIKLLQNNDGTLIAFCAVAELVGSGNDRTGIYSFKRDPATKVWTKLSGPTYLTSSYIVPGPYILDYSFYATRYK